MRNVKSRHVRRLWLSLVRFPAWLPVMSYGIANGDRGHLKSAFGGGIQPQVPWPPFRPQR